MITKVANNPAVQCLQTNLCCVVTLVAILFGACVFIYVKMPRDQNKNLTDEQRRDMLWFLQQRASAENKNGLKRNAMKDAAIHFECSAKCVQRIWKRAQVNTFIFVYKFILISQIALFHSSAHMISTGESAFLL